MPILGFSMNVRFNYAENYTNLYFAVLLANEKLIETTDENAKYSLL